MPVESVVAALLLMFCAMIGAVFVLLRLRYRRRVCRGEQGGFCPTASALGNALHTLQITAVPQIAYVMEEKEDDHAEDAEAGEPDGEEAMRKQLLRQALRIRNGKHVGRITVCSSRQR